MSKGPVHHPEKKPKLLRRRLLAPTPETSPVLCQIRTGTSTCSQLVATLQTTLDTSLSDVRIRLTGIASQARHRVPFETAAGAGVLSMASGTAAGQPVNYQDPAALEAVATARLHPFDLTASFRFVRRGGSHAIPVGKEAVLRIADVLPLIPPYGFPTTAGWTYQPPIGTVVVQPAASPTLGGDAGKTVTLREAAVVLFVAQGDFIDDPTSHSERVVLDRLLLQHQGYGRQATVKQLSATVSKWNANVKDFLGRAALHEYSAEGNFSAVKYLLSLPFVRVNETDGSGNTPLHAAAAAGHVDCVQALLDTGAEVLATNISGRTPLHVALYKRRDAVVEQLCKRLRLQQVPLVELLKFRDVCGFSPVSLFHALVPSIEELVQVGNVEALRAMTRHFLVNPKLLWNPRRNLNNDFILHLAARSGHDDVMRFLLDEMKWISVFISNEERRKPAAKWEDGLLNGSKRSPLHIAAAMGHTAVVRRLLPLMPMMCAVPDATGCTPLMLALGSGKLATALFIVENASNCGARCADRRGLTALHYVAGCQNPGSQTALDVAVRLLTKHEAVVDAHVSTPVVQKRRASGDLVRPSVADRLELLRFLRAVRMRFAHCYRRKAPAARPIYDKRTVAVEGPTPLWSAIHAPQGRGLSMALLLMSHGAGSTFVSEAYLPKLVIRALSQQQWELGSALARLMGASVTTDALILPHFLNLLRQVPPNMSSQTTKATVVETIRWLVDRKIGVDAAGGLGVQSAAASGDIRTLTYVLDSCSPTAVGSHALDTAVLLSVKNDDFSMTGELIRRGASATNVDEHRSPLIAAARLGRESILRALSALPGVSTFDAVAALLATMVATPRDASEQVIAARSSMSLALLQRILLTDAHVHPIEMLHLAASKGLFLVVDNIVTRLVALPSDARVAIVKSSPSPSVRPTIVVQCKNAAETEQQRRHRERLSKRKRNKPLYKPVISFERFVYTAPSPLVLEHRQKHRDVFSFAAAAGRLEIVSKLIVDLRLSPWRGADLRGWNAVDYALDLGHYDVALLLMASGVLPLKPHGGLPGKTTLSSSLGRLCAAAKLAVAHVQRLTDQGPLTSLRGMLETLASLGYSEVLKDLLQHLCVVLRQSTLDGVAWLAAVVRAATTSHQQAVVEALLPAFITTVSQPLGDGEELLVSALAAGAPIGIVERLVAFGAPVHVPSAISKSTIRMLKARAGISLSTSQKLTALQIAAALRNVDVCRLLLCKAGPLDAPSDVALHPLCLAVGSAPRSFDEVKLVVLAEVLLDGLGKLAGEVVTAVAEHATLIAAKKRFSTVALIITNRFGFHTLTKNLGEQADVHASILYHVVAGGRSTTDRRQAADNLLPTALSALVPVEALKLAATLSGLEDHGLLLSTAASNGLAQTCALLSLLGIKPSPRKIVESSSPVRRGKTHRTALEILHLNAGSADQVGLLNSNSAAIRVLQHATAHGSIDALQTLLRAYQMLAEIQDEAAQGDERRCVPAPLPVGSLIGTAIATQRWSHAEVLMRLLLDEGVHATLPSSALLQAIMWDSIRPRSASGTLSGFGSALQLLLHGFHSPSGDAKSSAHFMHQPEDLWVVLRQAASPLASHVLSLQQRKYLVFERADLTLVRVTPILLAAALGDEGQLRLLLDHGANPACTFSEACRSRTSLHTRREKYCSATGRWRRSTMTAQPQRLAVAKRGDRTALSHVFRTMPLLDTEGGSPTSVCRLSPLMVALYALWESSHRSKHGRDSVEYSQRLSIVQLLLRRGALTRDLINPAALIAATLSLWDLLIAIIEESIQLEQRLGGGTFSNDRFFKTLTSDDIPCILRCAVGQYRHVLHASCASGTRDVILLVARHSLRSDVEGSVDQLGRTPLFYAASRDRVDALETLVALQVPMNGVCEVRRQWTPLMVASKRGTAASVAALIRFGGIIQHDSLGNTALHFAASSGKQDVVELLLSAQADASARNDAGYTPAMLAAQQGFDHIALPMAQHFSRLASYVTQTTTLLHCATIGGCRRLAEYLVRTYDALGVFQEDSDGGHTPLYLAYAFGRGGILRMMITELQHRTEAPVDELNEKILACTTSVERYGWLRTTLRTGEALIGETVKRLGRPAISSILPTATSAFEYDCGPLLRPLRAEPSRLMWCAKNSCAVGVRALADLNVCDDCFALHESSKRGCLDVVQLLVALKMSDPNLRDKRGRLPLDYAIMGRHDGCVTFLVQNMRLTVDSVYESLSTTGSSMLHMMAMSGCHKALAVVLPKLLQGSQATLSAASAGKDAFGVDQHAAETALRCMMSTDGEGRTAFEVAVLFGSAPTVLRIAQALQQLATVACTEAVITLPSTLFELQPNFSPAVRSVLYDFFDVHEVFTASAFPEAKGSERIKNAKWRDLPGGDGSHRLLFGDVRLIGISQLRGDPFCSPKLDSVFTVDHERQVLKHITQIMELPFRLKFRPESLKNLAPAEQVAILQRISSMALLGKYAVLPTTASPSVGTVELEAVTTRAETSLAWNGSTVIERFFCSKSLLHTFDIQKRVDAENFAECRQEMALLTSMLKSLSQQLKQMSHPLLRSLVLRVDWNGLRTTRLDLASNQADGSLPLVTPLSDAGLAAEQLHRIATASVQYLITHLVPALSQILIDGAISSELRDVNLADLESIVLFGAGNAGSSTANANSIQGIVLRCYDSLDAVPSPATANSHRLSAFLEGVDIVIPFLASPLPSAHPFLQWKPTEIRNQKLQAILDAGCSPILNAVSRDVALLHVHKARDHFVAALGALFQRAQSGGHDLTTGSRASPIKFKLETEGTEADIGTMPRHIFDATLSAVLMAMEMLLQPLLNENKSSTGHRWWKSLKSRHIVAQSLLSSVQSVMILYSTKRPPAARRSGNRLVLCFTPTLAPHVTEIVYAIRVDTVDHELERLREQLPITVNDMTQRLNTYLPTTTLVVDLPSLSDLPGDDDVLSALALLHHDRSAKILQTIIRGVSVGWDSKLGALIRRHVNQISVTLQRGGGPMTLSLLPSGHLVLYYPLQCVELTAVRLSPWLLPSAQHIASLLLMALASYHAEVRSFVDVERGYACWCAARGLNTREVVAGDVRSNFVISVKNVLNAPPKKPSEELFEFSSNVSLSSLRVTPVKSSGNRGTLAYRVQFAAPTDVNRLFLLSVKLHGQPILNSPLCISVRSAPCSPSQTKVISTFNTVVAKTSFQVEYQLCDAHGNRLTSTPRDLGVEGPSMLSGNADVGAKVIAWASPRPGVVRIVAVVDTPSKQALVAVRFQVGAEPFVVPFGVECVSPETYNGIIALKRGPVCAADTAAKQPQEAKKTRDRIGLYFRSKIRENEKAKRQRDARILGGVRNRRFPPVLK